MISVFENPSVARCFSILAILEGSTAPLQMLFPPRITRFPPILTKDIVLLSPGSNRILVPAALNSMFVH